MDRRKISSLHTEVKIATFSKIPFVLQGVDGKALRGDVRTAGDGSGRPAIVIAHGFKGFKEWGFFPFLADRIARAGFTAVSFNFSGSGVGEDGESFSEPERFSRNTYSNQVADLAIVTTALSYKTLIGGLAVPTALGLVGHSMGGAACALYVARHSDVAALVTWSGIG
ncbi:MAG: alpha/beta hydrolase family protein, partial [Gemmatimonadales bacterium]